MWHCAATEVLCVAHSLGAPGREHDLEILLRACVFGKGGKKGDWKGLALTLLLSLCTRVATQKTWVTAETPCIPSPIHMRQPGCIDGADVLGCAHGRALPCSTRSWAVTLQTDNSRVNCQVQTQASFKLDKTPMYPNTASVAACTSTWWAKSWVIWRWIGVRGLLSGWVKFSCSLLD